MRRMGRTPASNRRDPFADLADDEEDGQHQVGAGVGPAQLRRAALPAGQPAQAALRRKECNATRHRTLSDTDMIWQAALQWRQREAGGKSMRASRQLVIGSSRLEKPSAAG